MSPAWRKHVWLNRAQSALLGLVLLGMVAVMGQLVLGETGLWLALSLGVGVLLFEPAAGGRITLAAYRARPLSAASAPGLRAMVHKLAVRAGLPAIPRLYLVPSAMVNAFAVGTRRTPFIAVTEGLLGALNPRELAGVLAHEMAHIAKGDLRVMGLADTASRLTSMLSMAGQLMVFLALPYAFLAQITINWWALLVLVFAPHLALLAQLGLSRVREFDADLFAVRLTGDPEGLASGLAKIERVSYSLHRWLLPGWGTPEPSWLRTHPATQERVKRLLALRQDESRITEWAATGWQSSHTVPASPRWRFGGVWR